MVGMDDVMLWGLVRLFLVMLIVVPAAFFATRWYAKRQSPGKNLRVKEALSLGANKAVYVIEWEDRSLLLGVTNHSITLLDQKPAQVGEVDE